VNRDPSDDEAADALAKLFVIACVAVLAWWRPEILF
jgi:hypothetical protein